MKTEGFSINLNFFIIKYLKMHSLVKNYFWALHQIVTTLVLP
jgi:hypothetical protein